MKEKILLLLLLFLFAHKADAQGENHYWYFGTNAGIAFNGGILPDVLSGSPLVSIEACSTISDSNGNLLFLSNGVDVWNKNLQIMQNGSDLAGHISTSQMAIVPKPGSSTIYYIFTIDASFQTQTLRYSIVDMALDNGLGAITQKNIFLFTGSTEKIAVAKHSNHSDYWIITHAVGNTFNVFNINASGVNPNPVVSSAGVMVTDAPDSKMGQSRISPDGTKYLAAHYGAKKVELLDFNAATGVLSNAVTIYKNDQSIALYGVEFSPNGKIAYVDDLLASDIRQFDLTAANIPASQIILPTIEVRSISDLQRGPDGKIYVSNSRRSSIGVIANPNVMGTGCNYIQAAVNLGGNGTCYLGFPALHELQPASDTSIASTHYCADSAATFSLTNGHNIHNVVWDFGDGTTSSDLNPTHQYTAAGQYTVTVHFMSGSDAVLKTYTLYIPQAPVSQNVSKWVCGNEGMAVDLSEFDGSFLGAQNPSDYGVAYYTSLDDLLSGDNVVDGPVSVSAGETIFYTKVYNTTHPDCYIHVALKVVFAALPVNAAIPPVYICDGPENDGVAAFTLSDYDPLATGQPNNTAVKVSYYDSQSAADTGTAFLPDHYVNIQNPQTVFVRVQSIYNPSCYKTMPFVLHVALQPHADPVPDLVKCGNVAAFDLTAQDAFALGGQSASLYSVSYYHTSDDAVSAVNQIPESYSSSQDRETIFVRVSDAASHSCFAITSFNLVNRTFAVPFFKDTYAACEGNPASISAPFGFQYIWSNGATARNITLSAGTYTLTIIKDFGDIACDHTYSFSVVNSSKAMVREIRVGDWTQESNTIQVIADGQGDYQYSIDGDTYQGNPEFNNLTAGIYTVFVKDKNGCGVVNTDAVVLNYPKFFTPNGDGYNDVWFIRNATKEPGLSFAIFDRYGKLLYATDNIRGFWDGTYNGQPLPSDDYWFVVERAGNRVFKGHFSLVR